MNNVLIKVLLLCICKTVQGLELELDLGLKPELRLESESESESEQHQLSSPPYDEYLRKNKNRNIGEVDGSDGDNNDDDGSGTKLWDHLSHFLAFVKQYSSASSSSSSDAENAKTTPMPMSMVSTNNNNDGISFKREITILDNDLNVRFGFDDNDNDNNHCKSNDKYGDNECHYNWGETMNVTIDVQLKKQNQEDDCFQKEDRIQAKLKVDFFVAWNFDCPICGSNCTVTIPIVDLDVHIPMPSCPLGKEDIPSLLQMYLGDSSPFGGVPLHVQGDLSLMRGGDVVIATSHVMVDIK